MKTTLGGAVVAAGEAWKAESRAWMANAILKDLFTNAASLGRQSDVMPPGRRKFWALTRNGKLNEKTASGGALQVAALTALETPGVGFLMMARESWLRFRRAAIG